MACTRRAEQELQKRAAQEEVSQESTKRQVRAGAIQKMFEEDQNSTRFEVACLLVAPLQQELQRCLGS